MAKGKKRKDGSEEGPTSLFIMSENNFIRRNTKFIIEWPVFEYAVLITIIANCVVLALEEHLPGGDRTPLAQELVIVTSFSWPQFSTTLSSSSSPPFDCPHTFSPFITILCCVLISKLCTVVIGIHDVHCFCIEKQNKEEEMRIRKWSEKKKSEKKSFHFFPPFSMETFHCRRWKIISFPSFPLLMIVKNSVSRLLFFRHLLSTFTHTIN